MRLTQDQIDVIAYRVVHDLQRHAMIDTSDAEDLESRVQAVIVEELAIEDQLNDEVRELMRQYETQIRRADVEYHEMFKVIKSKLARERNIIL